MRGFKYQSHNLIVLGVIIVFYKAYSLFKRFSFLFSLYAFTHYYISFAKIL